MNTAMTWQTVSTGLDDTLQYAAAIGSRLRGGEVIELVSDLGGGKTSFVRGLATGLGSQDAVRSPSFTLSNQYKAGTLTMHHFDFYRLAEPGIMREELHEVLADPTAIVVVEWGELMHDVLPQPHVTIHITVIDEQSREITSTYAPEFAYLFPDNT